MKLSKFFIIILSFILIYNTAVALAEAGFTRIPSNGTYELNNTIEKLIAINQESSQRMEQLTGERSFSMKNW